MKWTGIIIWNGVLHSRAWVTQLNATKRLWDSFPQFIWHMLKFSFQSFLFVWVKRALYRFLDELPEKKIKNKAIPLNLASPFEGPNDRGKLKCTSWRHLLRPPRTAATFRVVAGALLLQRRDDSMAPSVVAGVQHSGRSAVSMCGTVHGICDMLSTSVVYACVGLFKFDINYSCNWKYSC